MNKTTLFATAVIAGALVAAGASAQTFKNYGKEAGWDIVINEKMGPGCLMALKNDQGAQLQMGVDATTAEKRGYIAVYFKGGSVKAGETFSADFDVDGEKFTGEAVGQQLKGFDGAFAPVNNPEFIYDLAKKQKLTITAPGHDAVVVSLAGTDAAFKALRACQEAQ